MAHLSEPPCKASAMRRMLSRKWGMDVLPLRHTLTRDDLFIIRVDEPSWSILHNHSNGSNTYGLRHDLAVHFPECLYGAFKKLVIDESRRAALAEAKNQSLAAVLSLGIFESVSAIPKTSVFAPPKPIRFEHSFSRTYALAAKRGFCPPL
jgi:hypothetical protein